MSEEPTSVRKHKIWSKEEDQLLSDLWGSLSVAAIARRLGRTENAVVVRHNRLCLGAFLNAGECVPLHQVFQAIGKDGSTGYAKTSWILNRGMPVHKKRVNKCSFMVVNLDEFWQWAEAHRSFIDFSKMEPLALGAEPAWVAQQRKHDYMAFVQQRKDPWTKADDEKLRHLLAMHQFGYAELSQVLRRSAGAIQKRIADLGIEERPIKASAHGDEWNDSDYSILADGIRNGQSYTCIAQLIGKSEKAIRGKVYYQYLTENADKVRRLLGDGPWGCNAPVPTVRQAVTLTRTRKQTKADLEQLAGILLHRLQALRGSHYDLYWQRSMCMLWDDRKGICSAGCSDCDSCAEFCRVRPQYCVRCGATFYERAENRRCSKCRSERKKQAAVKFYKTRGRE